MGAEASQVRKGAWTLRTSGREHRWHDGLLAAELWHDARQPAVLDLRDGPYALVLCEFDEEGRSLRLGIVAMANPWGGVIRGEIELASGEWSGAGNNSPLPISRFIEQFVARGVVLGEWPVEAKPAAPASAPKSPRAPAVAAAVRSPVAPEPPREEPARVEATRVVEPATERVAGVSRVMKSKDGAWVFELEESGRYEMAASGARRAYYFVRVVRAADGRVIADTRKSGRDGWVIGDEIQVSKPGDGEMWMAIDTVYGEYWWENVRGPLSAVEDIAGAAGEW